MVSRIVAIIAAIAGVIAFMPTENMDHLMVIIDRWTVLMVVIFAVVVIFTVLAARRQKHDDDTYYKEKTAGATN